ncbi:hypothetical protein MERGE_002371 [Pneumocystis wakefieldiae]|uniref:HIG1 domain-containing protein n=1 Tax=Pneumocystis wakefieldiae TaxID=38082 RepID=A0A899FX93_9ASCO|nr:hypothetical protein MERGE_002371 [Pneumocystis wakefieldiae]
METKNAKTKKQKIFTKEEEEEHYHAVINSGIKSGIIALATALVISSDNASKRYKESRYGPFNPAKSIKNSNTQSVLFKWCSENKWKIIGGSWVLGMIGSMSLLWKDKYLTKTQKLVQARMYSQAITLIILLISAGLSMDHYPFFGSNNDSKSADDNHKKESS